MRFANLFLAVIAFLWAAFPALANDAVDCGYPLNDTERTFCAEKALSDAEQAMATALIRALAKMKELDAALPDHLKGSPGALEDAQAACGDFRDKDCAAYSFPFKGGTRGNELYRSCMIVMTMQRTDDLNAMVEDYGG